MTSVSLVPVIQIIIVEQRAADERTHIRFFIKFARDFHAFIRDFNRMAKTRLFCRGADIFLPAPFYPIAVFPARIKRLNLSFKILFKVVCSVEFFPRKFGSAEMPVSGGRLVYGTAQVQSFYYRIRAHIEFLGYNIRDFFVR